VFKNLNEEYLNQKFNKQNRNTFTSKSKPKFKLGWDPLQSIWIGWDPVLVLSGALLSKIKFWTIMPLIMQGPDTLRSKWIGEDPSLFKLVYATKNLPRKKMYKDNQFKNLYMKTKTYMSQYKYKIKQNPLIYEIIYMWKTLKI
jgi:hypothetical protein